MQNLTDKSYWDKTYQLRKPDGGRPFNGFLNYSNRLILDKLNAANMYDKDILEIGAGDSQWIPYLAKRFPSSRFTGMDYSEIGCSLLQERVRDAGVPCNVRQQDLFADASDLHGRFDLVYSLGVVEHFDQLPQVLLAKRRFLRPAGQMFTLIPNMAGWLGSLTKVFNPAVYTKHNPHDLPAFLQGHRAAGLLVEKGGYLGSSDFGVLSSCLDEQSGWARHVQRILIATSVAGWWIEEQLSVAPTSRRLSPYIFAVSRIA